MSAEWHKFLNLPKHDSIKRVCQLNSATAQDFIVNHTNGLILIVKESGSAQQSSCGDNDFAETSAQLLANRNITVCELSLIGETNSPFGNEGDVIVYQNGKQYPYYGRRHSTALLSFVLKLSSSHVKVITGRLDKKAYDMVPGPKLVGFFMPATPDLIAYETVALQYSPSIPFYVVSDRNVSITYFQTKKCSKLIQLFLHTINSSSTFFMHLIKTIFPHISDFDLMQSQLKLNLNFFYLKFNQNII
jgi:hypothetical protein